jgi:hypothetical protein
MKRTAAPLGRRRIADVAVTANCPLTLLLLLLTIRQVDVLPLEAVLANVSTPTLTRAVNAIHLRTVNLLLQTLKRKGSLYARSVRFWAWNWSSVRTP